MTLEEFKDQWFKASAKPCSKWDDELWAEREFRMAIFAEKYMEKLLAVAEAAQKVSEGIEYGRYASETHLVDAVENLLEVKP